MSGKGELLDPVYLPHTEEELKRHFAPVKKQGRIAKGWGLGRYFQKAGLAHLGGF